MKDLCATKKILGMEIIRDRSVGKFFLSQQAYVEKVLKLFNMNNAKPVTIQFPAHFKLCTDMSPKTDEEIEHMSSVPSSSAVGSIMYAMDQMETMVAAVTTDATSNSQDDDSQEISINVNCLYFDIVGGGKKRCVYGLGSHASTLYLDSFSSSATLHRIAMVTDHVADKCIRVLEEEIVLMREN
ncbi:hypothetical protein GH714_031694 [Hevea brasiliensis]|uniref:Reverse transcriptase Ty1/copia-type domain-containing protein n=1 Tax=Hevea brasiliensis TaxID=3981 RepID=A0A6A6N8K2_HEVBR|nr:hypothetical protein GH714_031694 [Hevea brasiliensis]